MWVVTRVSPTVARRVESTESLTAVKWAAATDRKKADWTVPWRAVTTDTMWAESKGLKRAVQTERRSAGARAMSTVGPRAGWTVWKWAGVTAPRRAALKECMWAAWMAAPTAGCWDSPKAGTMGFQMVAHLAGKSAARTVARRANRRAETRAA